MKNSVGISDTIELFADDTEEQTDKKESNIVYAFEYINVMQQGGRLSVQFDKYVPFFRNDDQANSANHSLKVYTPSDNFI